ncbi:MAG: Transcriptional regulator, IclR family [uncultured Chloroflexi bacterium]|uniref:Glycerol operon regulatory protein n=1 Tax=uncultured Chloroflexota bacterium TaxID=166587 RepID=A0A6J4IWQ7_9CHLR|nr:MAG: Transcriptional regulator, IclR family [uncultured Chloroflexota bacterium]
MAPPAPFNGTAGEVRAVRPSARVASPHSPSTGKPAPAGEGITSLEKGLAVLEHLSAARGGAGVSELARELSLPKSTVARLLFVLSSRGYVWREPARPRYCLGPRALELTANALDELLVVGQARPHLYDLAGKTDRVACLGVLWAGIAIVVDLVEPPAASPAALSHEPLVVGRGAPAYASSLGKAILAHRSPADLEHFLATAPRVQRTPRTLVDAAAFKEHLATVRTQGWAINDYESTDHGASIAAPIFNHAGEVLAAVAATESHPLGGQAPSDLIAAVVEAGRRISFNLGYRPRAFTATRDRGPNRVAGTAGVASI